MKAIGGAAFVLIVLAGAVVVFYVSWFWRALIIPMVIIILIDLANRIFKKKN